MSVKKITAAVAMICIASGVLAGGEQEAHREEMLAQIAKEAGIDASKARELRQQLEAELDMRALLAGKAIEQGLDRQVDVRSRLALSKLAVLSQALLDKIAEGAKPAEDDVLADYDSSYPPVKMARVKFALFAEKGAAEKALSGLASGEIDMAKAAEMGDDKLLAQARGDFGWVELDALPEELAKELEKPGARRPASPVKTAFGHVVYELEGLELRRQKSLEEARGELVERRKQMAVRSELAKLRREVGKIER